MVPHTDGRSPRFDLGLNFSFLLAAARLARRARLARALLGSFRAADQPAQPPGGVSETLLCQSKTKK